MQYKSFHRSAVAQAARDDRSTSNRTITTVAPWTRRTLTVCKGGAGPHPRDNPNRCRNLSAADRIERAGLAFGVTLQGGTGGGAGAGSCLSLPAAPSSVPPPHSPNLSAEPAPNSPVSGCLPRESGEEGGQCRWVVRGAAPPRLPPKLPGKRRQPRLGDSPCECIRRAAGASQYCRGDPSALKSAHSGRPHTSIAAAAAAVQPTTVIRVLFSSASISSRRSHQPTLRIPRFPRWQRWPRAWSAPLGLDRSGRLELTGAGPFEEEGPCPDTEDT